jgi:hypothetical protein
VFVVANVFGSIAHHNIAPTFAAWPSADAGIDLGIAQANSEQSIHVDIIYALRAPSTSLCKFINSTRG